MEAMRWPWQTKKSADLLAWEGGLVTVATNVDAGPQDVLEVQARLPGGEQFDARLAVVHEIEPDFYLEERRQHLGYAPRRHLYCARLVAPAEAADHLEVLLENLPCEGMHHHRLAQRVECTVRVSSLDFKNYHGLTRDLSETGVGLVTDGPLPVGLETALRFEFTRPPYHLEAVGRVRWSRPAPYGGRHESHASGLEFVHLSQDQRMALGMYLNAVRSEAGLWDRSRYHW